VRTGTNGILVPDGDIEGMADGLRTLIEDEEGRRRCADGAIAAAQAYKMEAVGPRWERLIERVS
jgi:glycosyltransferase involved in cell wall biosynthesis